MGEIVDIKSTRLEENHEFVADCCRYQEGLLTEARMRMKYGFADSVWEDLGANAALLEAVEDEKIRRVRDGSTKREKAQLLVTRAPDVVAKIMMDDNANARHRIDASKTLNDFAADEPGQSAPASDRFQIIIRLDADTTLRFDKSRAIDATDVDPFNPDDTPQGLLPITAAKKSQDGGNGQPV